jgi:hypothetical protein
MSGLYFDELTKCAPVALIAILRVVWERKRARPGG